MSVFGRISGQLIEAHKTIANHTATSEWERKALIGVTLSLLALLATVRKLHHQANNPPGGERAD